MSICRCEQQSLEWTTTGTVSQVNVDLMEDQHIVFLRILLVAIARVSVAYSQRWAVAFNDR
jgi:hypothetical protein